MILDITDYNPRKFEEALAWMNITFGPCYADSDKGADIVMYSDTWRVFKRRDFVEGFYETTWYLEFDNDSDATNFLLRWV